MLSERCRVLNSELSCNLDCEMSALSVRTAGMQATTVLDTRSLRVRGITATAIEGVRRNLFGCTDKEENRRFVERELARQLELDSQRWGFDFANEKPLAGTQRFAWHLVPASTVPPALRRTPIFMTTPPSEAVVTTQTKLQSSPDSSKRQTIITDFLKPRKRLSTSGKKSPSGHGHKHECGHGAHIRPPKVARLVQSHLKRPS